MPRVPEEIHVRVQLLDEGQVEAVRKIRRLLSDLSDALSALVPDDPDTGQPDTEECPDHGPFACPNDCTQRPDTTVRVDPYVMEVSGGFVRAHGAQLSDPDADKADPDNIHPVLRAKPDSGRTAGHVVREDDVRGICGQELPEPWVQGVRWCPRPPGHEEDCGQYGLRGM